MLRLASSGLVVVLACGGAPAPPAPGTDGEVPEDGSADGGVVGPVDDDDQDGLCNQTELDRNLDPADADTDGDGFSDYIEFILGYDPQLAEDPDRAYVFVLRENDSATLQVPIMHDVIGVGEDFTGAFESSPVPDLGDDSADTFYVESVATFAVPSENVAFLDEDYEAFRGVNGETLLGFEIRFAFSGATPRLCTRAFPFRYNIKANDGRLEYSDRFLLVTLPPGETLAGGAWCVPPGSCL